MLRGLPVLGKVVLLSPGPRRSAPDASAAERAGRDLVESAARRAIISPAASSRSAVMPSRNLTVSAGRAAGSAARSVVGTREPSGWMLAKTYPRASSHRIGKPSAVRRICARSSPERVTVTVVPSGCPMEKGVGMAGTAWAWKAAPVRRSKERYTDFFI